jgi:hypothetical protein
MVSLREIARNNYRDEKIEITLLKIVKIFKI